MTENKKCPRCGTENAATMRFCGNCGLELDPQAAGVASAAPPSRGFPVWGIVAIIGGVVAVAAVVTILLVTRDSEPEVTAPPPQEQTAGEQQGSTWVDQLYAYLPPEVTNCVDDDRGRPPGAVWLAEVTCNPSSGEAVVVGFRLYESPEAARSVYDEDLAAEGVAIDSGDCSIDTEAEHGWSGGGGQGRISCGQDSTGQADLTWTSDAFPVVGTMYATTTDLTVPDLYTVWQGVSDYTAQG